MRHHALELKPETVKPGQTVLIRAVAWDKRAINDWGLDLRPQETRQRLARRQDRGRRRQAAAALEQLDKPARRDLQDSGEADRSPARRPARVSLKKRAALPNAATPAPAEIRTQQMEIQKTSVDLVKSIGPADRQERLAIKRVLNGLAFGDMLQAVTRCESW